MVLLNKIRKYIDGIFKQADFWGKPVPMIKYTANKGGIQDEGYIYLCPRCQSEIGIQSTTGGFSYSLNICDECSMQVDYRIC